MLVVRGSKDVPSTARRAVLAIGNFDGVHRGHQALIAEARSIARGGLYGVMVFDPHPKEFFAPAVPQFRLTPLDMKLAALKAYSVPLVAVMPFDAPLANQTADAFIDDVLIKTFDIKGVVVGHDFRFGKGRTGDGTLLKSRGAAASFSVSIVAPVSDGATIISSTAIREALSRSDITRATQLLGRPWTVRGIVHGGAKRGTGMGYPTANITLPPGSTLGHGIYAVWVTVDGARHQGAAYLGTRPTFDNGAPVLETFLLDFDGNLYGKSIDITFIAHIRPDQAFPSMDALVAQMDNDVAQARAMLLAST
jgi:riboflavin kinase / FMN adenylyltransferase